MTAEPQQPGEVSAPTTTDTSRAAAACGRAPPRKLFLLAPDPVDANLVVFSLRCAALGRPRTAAYAAMAAVLAVALATYVAFRLLTSSFHLNAAAVSDWVDDGYAEFQPEHWSCVEGGFQIRKSASCSPSHLRVYNYQCIRS